MLKNNVTCKIKSSDSVGFIVSSLSNLTNNLARGHQKSKYKDCKSCLECI